MSSLANYRPKNLNIDFILDINDTKEEQDRMMHFLN